MENQLKTNNQNRLLNLDKQLEAEIKAGLEEAKDPKNADLQALAIRTTTIYSKWVTKKCPECDYNFRKGDKVRLCPKCLQAYHDDDHEQLNCWNNHFQDNNVCKQGKSSYQGCNYKWNGEFPDNKDKSDRIVSPDFEKLTQQFFNGLETVWKPFGDAKVHKVLEDDEMDGNKCLICSLKIRPGDRVVKCPCKKCNVYFHDDIFRHLVCWDEWNKLKNKTYCPNCQDRLTEFEDNEDKQNA